VIHNLDKAHSYDLLRVRSQQCAGDPSTNAHDYPTVGTVDVPFHRTLLFLCGGSPVLNFETQSRSEVTWCEAEFTFISSRQCGLTIYAPFLRKLPITFLRAALALRVLPPRDHCSVAN
jgi:hypothetical protein